LFLRGFTEDGGNSFVQVEFECIICSESAVATVDENDAQSDGEPLRTLRECPNCNIETIWLER